MKKDNNKTFKGGKKLFLSVMLFSLIFFIPPVSAAYSSEITSVKVYDTSQSKWRDYGDIFVLPTKDIQISINVTNTGELQDKFFIGAEFWKVVSPSSNEQFSPSLWDLRSDRVDVYYGYQVETTTDVCGGIWPATLSSAKNQLGDQRGCDCYESYWKTTTSSCDAYRPYPSEYVIGYRLGGGCTQANGGSCPSGATCSLENDPNGNEILDVGETIQVNCSVPASYWKEVDFEEGEGIYFWIHETSKNIDKDGDGIKGEWWDDALTKYKELDMRVYTNVDQQIWCKKTHYSIIAGFVDQRKFTNDILLEGLSCKDSYDFRNDRVIHGYFTYLYKNSWFGPQGYSPCIYKGELARDDCFHYKEEEGEEVVTDEYEVNDEIVASLIMGYENACWMGKRFCPSGTVCAYGGGCCPPGKDMVCGGKCNSTSAALCCDNTIITVGGSGSGDRNTWSGTLNGNVSKANCTSAGSVGEHPPYLKAEIVTGSPAKALRCTAINNNPYGRTPEIKMCGDNSCYDWYAYQYCDSGDVKAKTGAPCYPSNGIDCEGGGECLGTSNHQARCCDPNVNLPPDTTNYYCGSSGQLKLGAEKWTYPWVEKCLLNPWNLNVFNKTGGKRFPAFGGKLVEIHVDIQNNRINYTLLKDPYNITPQFPEFYNNTSGVMKRRSSWDNVISYTNSTGHNVLGEYKKLPGIGNKKTYNLTVRVPTEFGVDELGEKIAVNISASGSFDSEVIEMNITCADKDGDGYLDEKCAPTQSDRDCNDTDPSANINISCVDIFTPQPKYISKSGRELTVPVEIQNQWTNEVKGIEIFLSKVPELEGMDYKFENCQGDVKNCQNSGSRRVGFDIGAAPDSDQVSTGTIDLVFDIPGNVPPKSYNFMIEVEEI